MGLKPLGIDEASLPYKSCFLFPVSNLLIFAFEQIMRIISYNVNGIRAAIKKGFIDWLATNPADVVCLQETKATSTDIDIRLLEDIGFEHHWFSAQKKGYSGVSILTKIKPSEVKIGTGHEMSDSEGRVIELQFGDIKLINAYIPNGNMGPVRQSYKYAWLNEMQDYLDDLRKENPKIILCGDYNIAHTEIDLFNPKGNQKTSGFLPEERAWFTSFLSSGWVDSFRHFNKEPHHYSWWTQRFPSNRADNKGWRLDYILVTEPLVPQLISASILPEIKHSDHCPVFAELLTTF